jgi:putative peptidoglycan lipid II flippase
MLPSLARRHASADAGGFSATVDWGARLTLLIGLPATLGLALLAGPLVSTVYQHGAVTEHDVHMTAWALVAYALGFLGFSLVKVLVTGFYARQETRIPLRYAVISFVLGMACSLSFTGLALWQQFVAPHAAIALATATGAWINAALLYRRLRRDAVYAPLAGWGRFGLRLLVANALMAALLLGLAGELSWWTGASAPDRAARLAGIVGAAVAVYFGALWALGLRVRDFRQSHA